MKNFTACFDLLGYESFLELNALDEIKRGWNSILVHIETSLSGGEFNRNNYHVVANLEHIKLSCQIISDTIIIWTHQPTGDQFNEMIRVTSEINWRLNRFGFPARGALSYGELDMMRGDLTNRMEFEISLYSIIGKNLALAHKKSANLNLAGCVIDQSVIEAIQLLGISDQVIKDHASLYNIPYKRDHPDYKEFLFDMADRNINEIALRNIQKDIIGSFTSFNKPLTDRAREILDNTINSTTILLDNQS